MGTETEEFVLCNIFYTPNFWTHKSRYAIHPLVIPEIGSRVLLLFFGFETQSSNLQLYMTVWANRQSSPSFDGQQQPVARWYLNEFGPKPCQITTPYIHSAIRKMSVQVKPFNVTNTDTSRWSTGVIMWTYCKGRWCVVWHHLQWQTALVGTRPLVTQQPADWKVL